MQEEKTHGAFIKLIRMIYLVLCVLILTVGMSFYIFIHSYISKVNMVSPDKQSSEDQPYVDTEIKQQEAGADQVEKAIEQEKDTAYASSKSTFFPYSYYSNLISPSLTPDTVKESGSEDMLAEQNDIDEIKESIRENYEAEVPLIHNRDAENILLLGYQRDSSQGIDDPVVMALLTIDRKSRKITIASFKQDIYLQIPGEGNHRLADAYQLGGVELLSDTLKKNFKLKIDCYIQVDILIFRDMIDAIGGLSLELTKDDLQRMNTCIRELNKSTGDATDADIVKKSGTRRLNGKQALAYIWSRSLLEEQEGRSDQENSLMKAIHQQLNDYDLTKLQSLLELIPNKVTTNMTESELIAFILAIPSYQDYRISTLNVPVEGSYQTIYIDKKPFLGIDFSVNISKLKDNILSK